MGSRHASRPWLSPLEPGRRRTRRRRPTGRLATCVLVTTGVALLTLLGLLSPLAGGAVLVAVVGLGGAALSRLS
jgi:hypothetical protein